MICGRLRRWEALYRPSVFPQAFVDRKSITSAKLFLLKIDDEGAIRGSLALERFAPTLVDVHAYGCRLAARRNEALREKGSLTAKSRRVYCGSYRLNVRSVRALVGTEGLDEVAEADVTHLVEEGEIAHGDLRIVLRERVGDIEGLKTAIADRLWNSSCGPIVHVCPSDRDLDNHPSELSDLAPKGVCAKVGYVGQLWRLARSYLCGWLWRRKAGVW